MATPFGAPYFNEFVVQVPAEGEELLAALRTEKVIGGLNLRKFYPELANHLLVCVTETVSKAAIDHTVELCRQHCGGGR
jgi:glycine dehydrogenase subunit 1